MYHLNFKGTHHEIGLKWGAGLYNRGINLLGNVPFPITKERLNWAQQCVPLYKNYYPEILLELEGIAQGQHIAPEQLHAVLFGMYCLIPSTCCSCFVVKSENGLILGRNSDFLTEIEKLYMNTSYTLKGNFYSFNANTTAFVEMEDGINEHGLAIGLTSVAPKAIQPGINAGFMLRLILERCQTTFEAIKIIKSIPAAGSYTFVIADKLENAVLVEGTPSQINVVNITENNPFVCSTNMFNTTKMRSQNNLPEDSWQAPERYTTLNKYLSTHKNITIKDCQNLLAGKHGMLCQYNRKTGKDTVWSVIYNLKNGDIYRCEGNPSRKKFIHYSYLPQRGRYVKNNI